LVDDRRVHDTDDDDGTTIARASARAMDMTVEMNVRARTRRDDARRGGAARIDVVGDDAECPKMLKMTTRRRRRAIVGTRARSTAMTTEGAASATARRAYAVAHGWEHASALSAAQSAALGTVAQAVIGTKWRREVARARVDAREGADGGEMDRDARASEGGREASTSEDERGEGNLSSARAFYAWYAGVEETVDEERRETHRRRADALRAEIELRESLLQLYDAVERGLVTMAEKRAELKTRSRRTQEESERMIAEKDRLEEFADALRDKLNYFDQLEKVAEQFQAGAIISAASDASGSEVAPREQILPMLKRLDDCLEFVASNPQYATSGSYGTKFKQLQTRAMSTVREYFVSALRKATKNVQDAAKGKKGSSGEYDEVVVDEGSETALLYVRFRTGAIELSNLTEELEKRGNHEEYAALLSDCHVLYCEQRAALLTGSVRAKMRAIAMAERGKDVLALARIGTAYLVEVCQAEYGLFKHFFPQTDPTGALSALMIPLGTYLSDILRPKYISITDLALLAQLVEALKSEILEDIAKKTENALALEPALRRIMSDVQERLIFRAQTYVKDQVGNYRATADDLDFPAKLVRALQAKSKGDNVEDDIANWYPPLERTLTCLSKLYRSVEVKTFAGLAQEAVSLCADNIAGAAQTVSTKATPVDGQLFLIKHLIILREQIAPFNAELAVSVKDLDFTHMRGHVRRMFGGEMSFFSLNSDNAFYQLASEGRPRVVESKIDSKKELEKQLKAACEAYIMTITKEVVDPMLSFITKVTAFRVSSSSQGKALRDAAFASEEKLAAVASQVKTALAERLPKAIYTMNLYLNSESTREALLKPIKSNIAEAFAQVAAVLERDFPAGTAARVGVLDPAQLAAAMEDADASTQ